MAFSLDEYLHRSVFHTPRPFSREEFKAYLFAQPQHDPGECVFVDDRPLNVESAGRVGMRAIRFENAAKLHRELAALGVQL